MFQYIFGALRDCLQPMSYVRHLTSPQDLLDSFDKEIYDQTKEVLYLRCMDTPPSFSTMFSKGDNFHDFLLAYLEDEVFPKWGLCLKNLLRWERILSFMR